MKYTLPSLALTSIASARALYPRDSSCCFGIQVSGSTVNGTLGQLSDGQNRVGPQGQSGTTYCLDGSKITDNSGRGCVITSANQFQCDQGATATGGFSLSSSAQIEYRTNGTFWACPADDDGDYNIYTDAIANMPKCVQVGLSSSNGTCAASSASSAVDAAVTAASSTAAPVTAASSVVVSSAEASSVAAPVASSNVSTTCEASTVVSTVSAQTETVTQYTTQQNDVSIPGSTQYETQVSQTTDTAYQTETDTAYSTEEQTQTAAGPTSTIVKTEEQTTTNWKTEEQTTTAYSTVIFNVMQSAVPVTVTVTQSAAPTTQIVTQSASPVTEETTESATQYITQSASPVVNTTQYAPTSAAPTTIAQASAALPTYSNSTASVSASANTSSCPGNLPDMSNYQAPRLIIPVNSNSPNTTYGTQYNAYIGGGNSTIFNFDIPSNFTGKQCTVILTLPTNDQLDTSFIKSSGSGGIDFKQLVSQATEDTSFSNAPAVEKDFGVQDITVGDAYTVTSDECQVGASTWELSATGDLQLEYFQDYNLCQMGLWIYSS